MNRERECNTIDLVMRGPTTITIDGTIFPGGEELEIENLQIDNVNLSISSTPANTLRLHNNNDGPIKFSISRENSRMALATVRYNAMEKSLTISGRGAEYLYQNTSIRSTPFLEFKDEILDQFNIEISNDSYNDFGLSRIDICLGMGCYVGLFLFQNELHQARCNPDYYMNRGRVVFRDMFNRWVNQVRRDEYNHQHQIQIVQAQVNVQPNDQMDEAAKNVPVKPNISEIIDASTDESNRLAIDVDWKRTLTASQLDLAKKSIENHKAETRRRDLILYGKIVPYQPNDSD